MSAYTLKSPPVTYTAIVRAASPVGYTDGTALTYTVDIRTDGHAGGAWVPASGPYDATEDARALFGALLGGLPYATVRELRRMLLESNQF